MLWVFLLSGFILFIYISRTDIREKYEDWKLKRKMRKWSKEEAQMFYRELMEEWENLKEDYGKFRDQFKRDSNEDD